MPVLKTYDLAPDGIHIKVNWECMLVSYSVFILCINTQAAVKQVKVETSVVIEDEKLGIRVWRIS